MPVTSAEVGVELGVVSPTAQQAQQWDSWISQALYLIGKRIEDVATLDPVDVDYVVLQAVVAHARQPGAESQRTVSVDDASVSMTYAKGAGRVFISDELWGLLDPDLMNQSGVGSTRLYGEPDAPEPSWWTSASTWTLP